MIILNQKKDIVINFSNVVSIYVQEKNVQVLMTFIEDALILGKYKTEERAKEVLNEIVDEYIKYATIENEIRSVKEVAILPKKYEMPKEWWRWVKSMSWQRQK